MVSSAAAVVSALESGSLVDLEEFIAIADAPFADELIELLLLQPNNTRFLHFALVLLGRNAGNVARIKPLVINLSIAWNASARFAAFLREQWKPHCCAEVWRMLKVDILEEEEDGGQAPSRFVSSSRLTAPAVKRPRMAAPPSTPSPRPPPPITPSSSSYTLGTAFAPVVVPKIPLVQLKRNGGRGALNHFVGEYLSNPKAHFRQVRAAVAPPPQPTATAAKPPKAAAAAAAKRAHPVVMSVPASPVRPASATAGGGNFVMESPVAAANHLVVMETPLPQSANSPALLHRTSTSHRTSAKRLFMDDDEEEAQ